MIVVDNTDMIKIDVYLTSVIDVYGINIVIDYANLNLKSQSVHISGGNGKNDATNSFYEFSWSSTSVVNGAIKLFTIVLNQKDISKDVAYSLSKDSYIVNEDMTKKDVDIFFKEI